MENTSPIHSTLVDLVQWLLALAIILGLGFPYLCEGQKSRDPITESPLVPEEISNVESRKDLWVALTQPFQKTGYGAAPQDLRKVTDLPETIEQIRISHNLIKREPFGKKEVSVKKKTDSENHRNARILTSRPEPGLDSKKALPGPAVENPRKSPIEHSGLKADRHPPPLNGEIAKSLFDSIIHEAANRYEVDPDLVKAIIMAESSYNPKAVSKKGAKGLMQLMPRTAKSLGVIDIFDPEHNIDGGVRYFKQLLNQFNGDVKLALAAYNAGSKKVKKYRGIPPYKTTRHYVKKVIEYHRLYQR